MNFDKRADRELPGSSMRNEAASYLEAIHGNARIEIICEGKKVDIVCEVREHGKITDLFVEVKDLAKNLNRSDVSTIISDYSGVLEKGRSGKLLIVTRVGLSSSAQALVESKSSIFHQTIWEIEDGALGLIPYVEAQVGLFDSEGLREYYIPARAKLAQYDLEQTRTLAECDSPLFDAVESWLSEDCAPPLAILGGYGAGKSSFAKKLLSHQAARALNDPRARRPVLVKLGNITRSTGLDSLLGSLFTSEYEVRGYSFRRFKELNSKGRLLIILDGFDEMKHAMTWTEFRNELQELNTLNVPNSRILLLGRPSAFTSDDEHLEVLRGRHRVSGGTRRLHNWPEFREYELEPFTRSERVTFVEKFLKTAEAERCNKANISFDEASIASRAIEVNRIADQEDEVFGKPVHARILVELALDPEFNLESFSTGVTRWSLYAEFFSLLARRETKKPARSPIESDNRLIFLRRVALWLWKNRDGATSFRAADLQESILVDLPDGDTETLDDKRREYLAGAFLERKSADTYYFAHRSFAEFLVAEILASEPPTITQHEDYDSLVRDGVAVFLQAAPRDQGVHKWGHTLTRDSGRLTIEYFLFLGRSAGGFDKLVENMPSDTCWLPLLRLVSQPASAQMQRNEILSDTILKAPAVDNALLFATLARFPELFEDENELGVRNRIFSELSRVVAAALISRVVGSVREKTAMPRHTVEEKAAGMLHLAQAAISIEQDEDAARSIIFSWSKLADVAGAFVGKVGPVVVNQSGEYEYKEIEDQRIPYFEVRNLLSERVSEFFHQMVLKRCNLNSISIVMQN